ncbi:response regulator transcription factor [Algoriphagus sp. PAP.12]|uniref:response regulator transcription factor n=1 Tax=Algoriphagus sp. PAP.12 TaxID=2996678 RepID=UPI00227CAF24|nr:response regulator transcription factor [Algoriphagus sp. PAP.12]
MKILLIEDEESLAKDVIQYLSEKQYLCEIAKDFDSASEKILNYEYDCILLDLMLPGGSGLDLLQLLKNEGKQEGVIIISAKNSLEDKVKGLNLGADDYLAKPFHQAELAARIESLIRRSHFDSQNVKTFENLKIDFLAKKVQVDEIEVVLTKKEYDLLLFFIGNRNRVLSKSALAEHLSGDFADMFDSHDFVYAHVKNLKRKLKDAGCSEMIKTIYGTGYKWEA